MSLESIRKTCTDLISKYPHIVGFVTYGQSPNVHNDDLDMWCVYEGELEEQDKVSIIQALVASSGIDVDLFFRSKEDFDAGRISDYENLAIADIFGDDVKSSIIRADNLKDNSMLAIYVYATMVSFVGSITPKDIVRARSAIFLTRAGVSDWVALYHTYYKSLDYKQMAADEYLYKLSKYMIRIQLGLQLMELGDFQLLQAGDALKYRLIECLDCARGFDKIFHRTIIELTEDAVEKPFRSILDKSVLIRSGKEVVDRIGLSTQITTYLDFLQV